MEYRASCRDGRWTVDALMPATNGLSAWVAIADCGRPEPEDQMFDGFDPRRHAETIAAALNARASAQAPPKEPAVPRPLSSREKEELTVSAGVVAFSCVVSTAVFFVLLTPPDATLAAALLLAVSVAAFAGTVAVLKLFGGG